MKFLLPVALALIPFGLLRAEEASPTPSPAASPSVENPTTDETDAGSTALAPALREEVNLAETGNTEAMEIPVAPDAPDPRKTGEITETLPGDEPTPQRPPVTGTVEVTAANNGQTVKAGVGNLVRVTLESNPSTGYNWELRDFDYGAADFYGSDVVARKGGNVLVGAPGDTVITLQAVKPGAQTITIVYRRPWEAPDQVAATFSFQLEVAGDTAAPAASPAASPAP
jgi:inhibitor of cysteine peptidase